MEVSFGFKNIHSCEAVILAYAKLVEGGENIEFMRIN